MTYQHFIFSNRLQPRLLRHLIFWLAWFLFFEFTYFLPVYWYQGWNTQIVPPLVKEVGYFKFYLLVSSNTSLAVFIHVIFTYILLYFLAPRYLVKGRYLLFVLSVAALLIMAIVLFYFEFDYGNAYIRNFFGRPPKPWPRGDLFRCSFDMVLFNCPAVGGVALGIKLLKRWWIKQQESQQLATAKAGAELQLLKAQVHPHFLFNTLNNLYWFIINASPKATEMVRKLSGLLRYIIYECNQPFVPLEKELTLIRDYMALEKIRYGDGMDMTIDIRGDDKGILIAPLLLIPFIENSFKHGTSKMLSRPWLNLNIIIEEEKFYFLLTNSKPEEYAHLQQNGGLGLANVQKRLQLLYPGKHEVRVTKEPEHFTVLLEMNLHTVDQFAEKKFQKRDKHELV